MIAALPLITSAISSFLGPDQATSAAKSVATSGADSFSSLMASFSKDTVDKMKTSESMSVAGIQGKATTQSVVEAVMSAQESLQTALAIRDKAVSAFQDISKMPV
jgi:flagellar hook-basal body complex protein FliE